MELLASDSANLAAPSVVAAFRSSLVRVELLVSARRANQLSFVCHVIATKGHSSEYGVCFQCLSEIGGAFVVQIVTPEYRGIGWIPDIGLDLRLEIRRVVFSILGWISHYGVGFHKIYTEPSVYWERSLPIS